MPRNLIDLSKILPISLERAKKYIRCKHLWRAISPIPEKDMKIDIEEISDTKAKIHQEIKYTFTIGLTGLIKHTAHIVQDTLLEEVDENTYMMTVEKSNEVAKSEVLVKIEDLDDKINVKLALLKLYLKSGILELVGRQLVINRFRGELRKLLKKTATMLRNGSLDVALAKCDEELAKEQSDELY
ncbi:MAG: hypothetical protein ACTSQI_04945 [Candidatus Helarchaeota archaeon]